MFNDRDRRCATVQYMFSTDPSNDNRTIANTLKMQIRTVQRLRVQLNVSDDPSNGYGYGLSCDFKWGPHHATSHLRSRLESQHQSVRRCAEKCGDPLVQSDGRWQTLGVAAGIRAGLQFQTDPGLASERVLRLCTLLSLDPSSIDLNPLDYFVWSYVENITIITSHNNKRQPDRRHPLSIRWAPAGAYGRGMLPVLDPYRGSEWGWRRLHWIDVSSTT